MTRGLWPTCECIRATISVLILSHIIPLFLIRAPECFNDKLGGVSTKCDIFSFGVILWELVTQTRPWAGLNEFQMIYQVTVNNARLEIPKDNARCPPELQALMVSCWSNSPDDRPTAVEIQGALEELSKREDLIGKSC